MGYTGRGSRGAVCRYVVCVGNVSGSPDSALELQGSAISLSHLWIAISEKFY